MDRDGCPPQSSPDLKMQNRGKNTPAQSQSCFVLDGFGLQSRLVPSYTLISHGGCGCRRVSISTRKEHASILEECNLHLQQDLNSHATEYLNSRALLDA